MRLPQLPSKTSRRGAPRLVLVLSLAIALPLADHEFAAASTASKLQAPEAELAYAQPVFEPSAQTMTQASPGVFSIAAALVCFR